MFAALTTLLLAATSALALPSAVPRQVDTTCDGITAAFSTGGPYSLVAYNNTNPNGQGVPLVISPVLGYNYEDPGGRSLATYDTYPHYDYPNFSLDSGKLLAGDGGENGAGAKFTYIAGPLDFDVDAQYPDTSFCGLAGTSAYGDDEPVLTIYNDADNWSLCTSTSDYWPTPLNFVIYKPDSDAGNLYDYSSCYGVHIHLEAA